MNETVTARKPSGVYTVAGEVARAIEQHPGETARGLFRLHIERFAEFGIDGTYAAALVQQQLVKLEEQGQVRREKGATKSAPHTWFWIAPEAAQAARETVIERSSLTAAEPYVVGEPRVGVMPFWERPAFEVRQADPDAAVASAAVPATPAADEVLTCQVELQFKVGGTEVSFFHEGAWDERVALRLERFLLAAGAEDA